MTAQPPLSPDGRFWWNGTQWIPVPVPGSSWAPRAAPQGVAERSPIVLPVAVPRPISPDGMWWWDGAAWRPTRQLPQRPAWPQNAKVRERTLLAWTLFAGFGSACAQRLGRGRPRHVASATPPHHETDHSVPVDRKHATPTLVVGHGVTSHPPLTPGSSASPPASHGLRAMVCPNCGAPGAKPGQACVYCEVAPLPSDDFREPDTVAEEPRPAVLTFRVGSRGGRAWGRATLRRELLTLNGSETLRLAEWTVEAPASEFGEIIVRHHHFSAEVVVIIGANRWLLSKVPNRDLTSFIEWLSAQRPEVVIREVTDDVEMRLAQPVAERGERLSMGYRFKRWSRQLNAGLAAQNARKQRARAQIKIETYTSEREMAKGIKKRLSDGWTVQNQSQSESLGVLFTTIHYTVTYAKPT